MSTSIVEEKKITASHRRAIFGYLISLPYSTKLSLFKNEVVRIRSVDLKISCHVFSRDCACICLYIQKIKIFPKILGKEKQRLQWIRVKSKSAMLLSLKTAFWIKLINKCLSTNKFCRKGNKVCIHVFLL